MTKPLQEKIKGYLAKALARGLGMPERELAERLETPPARQLGNLAFPCFFLAKKLKKSPQDIALDLSKSVSLPKHFSKAEANKGYLNFFYDYEEIASRLLPEVLKDKAYGYSNVGRKRLLTIEHSSPNTNKPLHIGHLRNSFIGMSVARMHELNGFKVVKINYLNDRGAHICKSMLAYKRFGKNETPESSGLKGDQLVGKYYVLFNEKAKQDPKLEQEALKLLREWESGDKQAKDLWKEMDSWAVKGFKQTYKSIGAEFDKWYRESKIYGEGKKIISQGINKGVFEEQPDGSVLAVLEPHGLSNKTMLRADGTSLYISTDLALARHKLKDYKAWKNLYVVASEQNLYFQQLFKTLELLGNDPEKFQHLSYGMVNLPEGKMKSREGKVVDADQLVTAARIRELKEVAARDKGITDRLLEKRASRIALGAVKFYMLKTDHLKDMLFDLNEALSFEGETGPYVMYSGVRAKNILRKAGKKKQAKAVDLRKLSAEQEKDIIDLLLVFPSRVSEALQSMAPHIIARYCLDLAEKFNSFYHGLPVLKGGDLAPARLALVQAFLLVLGNALKLLAIELPEKM